MKGAWLAVAVCVAGSSVALAQDRLPIGTRVGSGVPPAGVSTVYDEAGRRDPFVSLLATKRNAVPPPARPRAGLAGVALADVAVKGIVHNGRGIVAVLEAPGGRSFVARAKDRLQDATIKLIDPDGVTFVQMVVDALGAARPRDVRKSLRQTTVEEER